VEELLAERSIQVDHVTIFRWVQRFTPLLIDATRPCRHAPGDRWFMDETYAKISAGGCICTEQSTSSGRSSTCWSPRSGPGGRPAILHPRPAARPSPIEVTTDRAAAYPRVLDELVPAACHITEQYGNNSIEADHGRLKSRLRPMRGLKQLRCARVTIAGHAFFQNLHRGHYELGAEETVNLRILAAFDELALVI
jgi:IS6 family transposase